MNKPLVALVGRPNVGKSTLFNRLVGERLAIVADLPGTTRDRHYADVEWQGLLFTLIDTGGLVLGDSDAMTSMVRAQAQLAIEDADGRLVTHVGVTVRTKTFFTQVKTGKLPEITNDPELVEVGARRVLARFEITRPVRLLGVRLDLALAPAAQRETETSQDS